MAFDILGRIEELSPTYLTLRERARLELNPNDLRWRVQAPIRRVNSIKIGEFTTVDFRPAGGRRDWHAQPREIPQVLGTPRTWEMIPVNPSRTWNERDLQLLQERAQTPRGGFVQAMYDEGIIDDVDTTATTLANASDVQVERDWYQSWFYNLLTVKDTKSNKAATVAIGNDASRYVAAPSTFAAAANAYTMFIDLLRDARTKLGSLGGVRFRQSLLTQILLDAPAVNGDRATLASLRQRLSDEGLGEIALTVDERTYHDFVDGGSAYTEQFYVPSDRMAVVPANGVVGTTYVAPVTRAWKYVDPSRVSDVRDFTIFHDSRDGGRTLVQEAQINALSIPNEQFVYVVTGL